MDLPRQAPAKRRTERKPAGDPTTCRVSLSSSRGRHLTWGAILAGAGLLLLLKLGTVGQWVGAVLLVIAAFHVKGLVLALLKPPGHIEVAAEEVVLPRGLARGSETFPVSEVKHAYFLRRAVPWARSSPVLIVEVGDRIFGYPRDWFAPGARGDADQKRVATVLNRRLGRA